MVCICCVLNKTPRSLRFVCEPNFYLIFYFIELKNFELLVSVFALGCILVAARQRLDLKCILSAPRNTCSVSLMRAKLHFYTNQLHNLLHNVAANRHVVWKVR